MTSSSQSRPPGRTTARACGCCCAPGSRAPHGRRSSSRMETTLNSSGRQVRRVGGKRSPDQSCTPLGAARTFVRLGSCQAQARRPHDQHQLLCCAHPPSAVLQDVGGVRQVYRVWTKDVYLGRPSLDHPIEATERVQGGGTVTTVKFWFATGGAGFCLSRGLALKMSPWASLGSFMSTAERVRLPDDCTVGYIVEGLLGARLLHSPLFHSHLENLRRLRPDAVLQQVTLSYGGPENPQNVVNVAGSFSIQQDPTRFQSVHCLLYPDTDWCPVKKRGKLAFR
ncbi:beta-1,3-N-acetylglucosaminyltransferase radical fringe isoform X2 [Nannospalax galili]|uniref:beta-1,3-N-acetylglucosaminyltransferase radical fringe isoform X2 n=1 Tax=Nannospalax galili TaxID=1026970 RepID=UPI00111C5DE2|nr:beta-1,3-N-acetylglucosaminyltransferase radical fringe isoform X2 [Nannospalax galili]